MRTCASCDHVNADHLAYCFGCGRRLRPVGADPALAETLGALPANLRLATTAPSSPALAATIALDTLGPLPGSRAAASGGRHHPLLRAYDAARYVFTTIRGRMDADERRRRLMQETDGARRMAEGTLVEIGQTVLAQRIPHPEVDPLTAAAVALRSRREAVNSDLAAAEKFQAAEDLRLGLLEASAEAEWKSCSDTARDVELALGRTESDRREARDALARHHAARVAGGATPPGDRATLEDRCAALDEQYRTLRERAAALRASSLGAKGKLEQATAARKLAAAAVGASVNGHSRERSEIDAELRRLTTQIGARAIERRVPSAFLTAPYERFDRLQATTRAQQNELARLERSRGGIDRSRFAAGLGLILGALTVCGAGVWALLH